MFPNAIEEPTIPIIPTKEPSIIDEFTTTVSTLIKDGIIHSHQRHKHKNDLLWAVILGSVLVLVMSFGLSANSTANASSTIFGSKIVTIKQALFLNIFFQLFAVIYVALTGSQTELQFIIELATYDKRRPHLLLGQVAMISGLAVWLLFVTYKKLPVSTGHSVIGATIGFSAVLNGVTAIRWSKILSIIISWMISPILSGFISLGIFKFVDYFILRKKNNIDYTTWALPILYSFSAFVNSFSILQSTVRDFGLSGIPLHLSFISSLTVGGIVGLLVLFFVEPMLCEHIEISGSAKPSRFKLTVDGKTQIFNQIRKTGAQKVRYVLTSFVNKYFQISNKEHTFSIEYQFGSVLLFTSGFVSFLQAVQNLRQSIVPLAILLMVYRNEHISDCAPPSPLLLCYVIPSICLGIYLWGGRVTETVGCKLANLYPVSAFIAQIGTTTTIVIAHEFGIPISITHCLVGSIMAVGLVDNKEIGIDWNSTKQVIIYWIITLPTTSILVALFSFFLHFAL